MPLHPQARAMIDAFAAGPALDYTTLTAAEFRAAFAIPAPARVASTSVEIADRSIASGAGPLRVRLYTPQGRGPFPITLYFHGGGFVIGSPEMTDGICRTLAAEANTVVVSPDYRLAPEAPFPCGLDDCWAALCWVQDQAPTIDGDAANVAVAGDSSGGNFAAVIAQRARDAGRALRHQLLLYPVIEPSFATSSYLEFASGYFLTAQMMRWYWNQYLPDATLARDARVSPNQHPDLRALAPATVFTAEYDVLRDEAEQYAAQLHAAGVAVTLRRWLGQIHGFLLQQGSIDDADAAVSEAGRALRGAFGVRLESPWRVSSGKICT